ncbi:hypothetical protein brsh051_20430 [Brooklawnia propionicigenes]|uniref:Uncharacterized protein n=2 Tax=Brooklawnia propionicigenes TaxID=3041175 RepID=A0AAN0K7C6_9ACTN|nr:hypothetical protein brsh051_20430 [Brooklawnia sp. SH051]
MNIDLATSIARMSALVNRALEHVDSGSDRRSGDVWWQLAASTLPAQLLILQAAFPQSPTDQPPDCPQLASCTSADLCLVHVDAELAAWDWDALDRETLRAGAQLVLDISDLLRMP